MGNDVKRTTTTKIKKNFKKNVQEGVACKIIDAYKATYHDNVPTTGKYKAMNLFPNHYRFISIRKIVNHFNQERRLAIVSHGPMYTYTVLVTCQPMATVPNLYSGSIIGHHMVQVLIGVSVLKNLQKT